MTSDFYSPENQKKARTSGFYDKVMANLKECPFCNLKEKYFVETRNDVVLTVNLFPYVDGHLMTIPRRHVSKLEELNDLEWSDIRHLIESGKLKLGEKFGVESFNVLYREGVKSGASLGHLHVHLIPAKELVFEKKFFKLEKAPIETAEILRN